MSAEVAQRSRPFRLIPHPSSLIPALLLVALVACYLPWTSHAAAAFNLNAYDLAEWVSLPPAARQGNPPLAESFMLRAVLAGMALLWGLQARRAGAPLLRPAFGALALILALTLLPPLDFFRGAWDDPNYRQQAGLAVSALLLVAGVFALRCLSLPWRRAEVTAGLLTGLAAIAGQFAALNALRPYRVEVSLGVGFVLLVASLGLYSLLAALPRGAH